MVLNILGEKNNREKATEKYNIKRTEREGKIQNCGLLTGESGYDYIWLLYLCLVLDSPNKAHLFTADVGQELIGAGWTDKPPPALRAIKHTQPLVSWVHLDWKEAKESYHKQSKH